MADEWDFSAVRRDGDDAFPDDYGTGFDADGDFGEDYSPDLDDVPDYDDFFLDEILSEYGGGRREAARREPPPPLRDRDGGDAGTDAGDGGDAGPDPGGEDAVSVRDVEDIAARSRRRAMDSVGGALRRHQSARPPETETEEEPPRRETLHAPETGRAGTAVWPAAPRPGGETEAEGPGTDMDAAGEGGDTYASPEAGPDMNETDVSSEPGESDNGRREAFDDFDIDEPAPPRRPRRASYSGAVQEEKRSFLERFLTPVIRLVATRLAKRQMQNAEAANWPDPVEIRETPELAPRKAAKYYARLAGNNRLRCRVASFLCIILVWISLKLPMAGMLGRSLALQSGVCLVLTLAVMVAALDVVAAGLRQLVDLRPGMEALAALAAVLSCVDAAFVLSGRGDSLPFCAVGALALASALWGQRLNCSALTRTFKTAAEAKTPSVLTSEPDGSKGPQSLLRSYRPSLEGIVRRSESQSLSQTVYAAASPILLAAALALSVLACVGGSWNRFLHILSALVAAGASFAAFFSFPLPYALAARRLRASGAAVAGYAGCAEIGKTRRIVIGDEDLFPPGTMEFTEINVLDGTSIKQVVTFTASLIAASGSGAAPLFADLMARRKYTMPQVYEFKCHEGGGLSGLVEGQRVLVGPAGYMNLMGIRLPHDIQSRDAICTAIGNELVGVFIISYKPVSAVQEALVTLMRGRTHVTFATRDFNITPLMIKKLFHISADNFSFPSFRDRYRMAAAAAREDAPIDAVITRPGMLPFAEAAEAGRKLCGTCLINTVLSVLGGAVGIAVLFILFRAGSFDTACVRNVLLFMLLWALPEVILSIGQNR